MPDLRPSRVRRDNLTGRLDVHRTSRHGPEHQQEMAVQNIGGRRKLPLSALRHSCVGGGEPISWSVHQRNRRLPSDQYTDSNADATTFEAAISPAVVAALSTTLEAAKHAADSAAKRTTLDPAFS